MSISYLQSAQNSLVVDIKAGTGGVLPGSPLQVYTQKTEPNQWWTMEPVPNQTGYFWIVSAEQDLVIDINTDGGVKSGSSLQAIEKKNETNQYWMTKDVPNQPGYFWLISADQGLAIDINNAGGVKSGSALQALTVKSEANQYWKWVSASEATPPSELGSNSNYFLYGGKTSAGKYIPLQDVVVTIDVTQDLVGTPPFNFQLNAYSPSNNVDGWQQYGISMAPSSKELNSFAENWPLSGNNLFNIEPDGFVSIPNERTIPKGYKIVIELTYESGGAGDINGSVVTVYDGTGTKLGAQTIALLGQDLAAGGKVTATDLAPIVAYQLNFVAWANSEVCALTSGAGTITYSSSTPMTAQSGRPSDAEEAVITAETANSIYSVMAGGSHTSMSQAFWISTDRAPIEMPGGHAKISRFMPVAVTR